VFHKDFYRCAIVRWSVKVMNGQTHKNLIHPVAGLYLEYLYRHGARISCGTAVLRPAGTAEPPGRFLARNPHPTSKRPGSPSVHPDLDSAALISSKAVSGQCQIV
jgi:hypothetical protein